MTGRRLWCAVTAVVLAVGPVSVLVPTAQAQTSGTVFLQTVPALAGVGLSIGSTYATTGSDGSATVQVADLNGIAHQVALAGGQYGYGTALSLRKVVTTPHSAPHQSRLLVGLDVTSQVRLNVDPAKTGIAASSVRSIRLRSVTGDQLVVDPQKTPTVSLLARRPRLVGGELTVQTVTWSVDRITAGAGVALTTSTPRFDPYGQGTWQLRLQPVHGTVQIATVPATPNVTFLIEGASVTTGTDGTAQAPVADLNNVSDRLSLDSHDAGPLSVSLLEVSKLKPTAQRQRRVLAAISVRKPVSLTFVDHDGGPIDTNRISEVVLDGGGEPIRLNPAQLDEPVMLLASLATQIDGVWRTRPVTYTVSSVRLDGSDAVFAGRQRIAPSTTDRWTVSLSVFSLTVAVHDVLFGARVRSRVVVGRPDGSTYPVTISAGSPTVVPSMVRGLYDVRVEAAVFGAHTKVLVSRNDAVDLRVVTLLDAVVIAIAGLALLAAVVLGGMMFTRRRARAVAQETRASALEAA